MSQATTCIIFEKDVWQLQAKKITLKHDDSL